VKGIGGRVHLLVVTADTFRRLALTMPEALEVGHMGYPDFRQDLCDSGLSGRGRWRSMRSRALRSHLDVHDKRQGLSARAA
jgi:hypothetical protein